MQKITKQEYLNMLKDKTFIKAGYSHDSIENIESALNKINFSATDINNAPQFKAKFYSTQIEHIGINNTDICTENFNGKNLYHTMIKDNFVCLFHTYLFNDGTQNTGLKILL